jgi:hypothetical protein
MPRKTYRPVGLGTSKTCFLWCRLGDLEGEAGFLACLTSPASRSPLNWERGAVEGGGDGSFPVCTTGVCSGSTTFDSIIISFYRFFCLSFFFSIMYCPLDRSKKGGVFQDGRTPAAAVLSEKLGRDQSEARTYQQRGFGRYAVAHWQMTLPD